MKQTLHSKRTLSETLGSELKLFRSHLSISVLVNEAVMLFIVEQDSEILKHKQISKTFQSLAQPAEQQSSVQTAVEGRRPKESTPPCSLCSHCCPGLSTSSRLQCLDKLSTVMGWGTESFTPSQSK